MTRTEAIELLQDQVQHNRLEKQEFYDRCKEYGLDWFDDVLGPMGYNVCDKCGDYGDSEADFCWVDSMDWDDSNPEDKIIIDNIAKEGVDYCAVCWDCLNQLKGEKNG